MPMYDSNGTTVYEIGKIYDFNRTTNSQISKVYDNNGSANSLIYTAQYAVFDNGNAVDYAGGWTRKSSGNGSYSMGTSIYTYAYNTKNSYRAYITSAKIPVSQFSKLTVDWQYSGKTYSTWGCARIALSNYNYISWTNGYPTGGFVVSAQSSAGTSRVTTTWDISGYTSDYYFVTVSCSGVDTYTGYNASSYVYSIILE